MKIIFKSGQELVLEEPDKESFEKMAKDFRNGVDFVELIDDSGIHLILKLSEVIIIQK